MGVAVDYVAAIARPCGVAFHGVDARGRLTRPAVYRVWDAHWPVGELLSALERGWHDGDELALAGADALPAQLIDPRQVPAASEALAHRAEEELRPRGLELHALMPLHDELRVVGVVSLLRALDKPPLTDAQRKLLRLGHALIEQAYVAARALPHESAADPLLRQHALTGREVEVVRLAGGGATNAEIARRLRLSPATVKTHLNHAYLKLGVRSRTQLTLLLADAGARTSSGVAPN
jgi:DNA-binding CsgD family transcriptional regulator